MNFNYYFALSLCAFLLSNAGCARIKDNCEAIGSKQPICGTRRPEDMAHIPNQPMLIISEMGDPTDHGVAGSLSLLNIETKAFTRLYPLDDNKDLPPNSDRLSVKNNKIWGDPDCPQHTPRILAPHGIHLSLRSDGDLQLLAVNHGSREAIEYFQLDLNNGNKSLQWRGCVIPKPATFMNNVVSLADGGFIATQAFDYEAFSFGPLNIELIKGILGWNTGYVFEWHPESGFKKVIGGDGRFVNGLALSKDEKSIYATYYMGHEVRRIDRNTGELLATTRIEEPDNLTWTDDGNLLVASHQGNLLDKLVCLKVTDAACVFKFGVYQLDPDTLSVKEVINHQGLPMGAVTVAKQVGEHLYLGSYAGNRVMQIPYFSN